MEGVDIFSNILSCRLLTPLLEYISDKVNLNFFKGYPDENSLVRDAMPSSQLLSVKL